MAKSKDPAFLFYSSDFLVGTMRMKNDEVGKYIKLLCIQHQNGGYLTEDDIEFICPEKDKRVMDKFIKQDDKFFNQRLLDEIIKRKKHSKRQSENAKKRWNKPKQCDGNANAMPLENENENEIVNIIKDINKDLSIKPNKYIKLLDTKSLEEIKKIITKDVKKAEENLKHKYGEYNHVLLTDKQHEKLKVDFPSIYTKMIKNLDEYIETTGKSYKNHNLVMRKWQNERPIKVEFKRENIVDPYGNEYGSPEFDQEAYDNAPTTITY